MKSNGHYLLLLNERILNANCMRFSSSQEYRKPFLSCFHIRLISIPFLLLIFLTINAILSLKMLLQEPLAYHFNLIIFIKDGTTRAHFEFDLISPVLTEIR